MEQLQDKLEILRESAAFQNHLTKLKQNESKNRHRFTRKYKPGDLVFSRIPGCRATLQASWEGPFTIVKYVPLLNYEITDPDKCWSKLVHINNLRSYSPLPQSSHSQDPIPTAVNAVCLVAEENTELSDVLHPKPQLPDDKCNDYSQPALDSLLKAHEDIFATVPGKAKVTPFTIKLENGASTSNKPPYQVPIHLRAEVNAEIDKLLSNNIIEPSTATDWCAPIVPVRKPDKSVRLCIDYRKINKVTPLDRHIIPTLPQILDRIGCSTVLSKVDLTSGFHQITVEPEYRDLTTFLSPKDKFRFVRMPFGLKNAPSHFQRTMEKVLAPVSDCAAIYIDDVIIFSSSWKEHLDHLVRVFECFRQAGLTAKSSKCSFGKSFVEYLGHTIGSGTLAVPEQRITALANYKRLTTTKTLRLFLGCMSYYRRFIDKYADMSALLSPFTSVSSPKVVVWTDDMDRAFQQLKVSLCNHVLVIPSISDTFSLHTDASGSGVGACLHVTRKGQELPIAFYSRQLQGAEKRYSITELETLAIVAALKHFEFYTYGTDITIYTDHKACTSILTSSVLNNRFKRMALYLQDKSLTFIYRPGKDSANADGMSRQFDDNTDADRPSTSTPSSKDSPRASASGVSPS